MNPKESEEQEMMELVDGLMKSLTVRGLSRRGTESSHSKTILTGIPISKSEEKRKALIEEMEGISDELDEIPSEFIKKWIKEIKEL